MLTMQITYERLNEIIEEEISSFANNTNESGLEQLFNTIRQETQKPHGARLLPHIKLKLGEVIKLLALAKKAEFSAEQNPDETVQQWAQRMKNLPNTYGKSRQEYNEYLKNSLPHNEPQQPVEKRYVSKPKTEKKKT